MRKLKDAITKENAAKVTFGLCAAFSIFAVFAIIVFVLYRSIPAFREVGVFISYSGRLEAYLGRQGLERRI